MLIGCSVQVLTSQEVQAPPGFNMYLVINGGTLLVAQLFEALRYNSEGRGFDSR
jgi:hypothetical protein